MVIEVMFLTLAFHELRGDCSSQEEENKNNKIQEIHEKIMAKNFPK